MNFKKQKTGLMHSPMFFDSFLLKDLSEGTAVSNKDPFKPAVNIAETDRGWELSVAAPGFHKEYFNVEFSKDMLTVSYQSPKNENEQEPKFLRKEFSSHDFKRSFVFPKAMVNEDAIEAQYINGVLRLNIPKREEAKPKAARQITVA